ncbi:hypothetical protein ACI2J5_00130 [Agrobacterium pusense]|uniref:hypothetical protein n=1 Tax=Agrobacterium pusense TaxID=648995 RepID=UPI00384E9BA5
MRKFELYPVLPAEPLKVTAQGGNQFRVEGKSAGRHFDEQYVEFSGFFGSYGADVFSAAPELADAARKALPYIDMNRRGGKQAMQALQSAIAKSEGRS